MAIFVEKKIKIEVQGTKEIISPFILAKLNSSGSTLGRCKQRKNRLSLTFTKVILYENTFTKKSLDNPFLKILYFSQVFVADVPRKKKFKGSFKLSEHF